ncbi:MAG: PaeR7I family type II restriction endonuclease [Bacteroidota bacterium]
MKEFRNYQSLLDKAIEQFWLTRRKQINDQRSKNTTDQGNRGAVTGGKQLDGFLKIMKTVALECRIPEGYIFTKGNHIPGYFRPSKDWDFLITTPQGKLLVAIEFKSQVGSFGNNFNNRAEEALGSAVDLWTAYRENTFPNQQPPWIGYVMVVEKSEKSTKPVRVRSPHFKTLVEFEGTSYLDRYSIFCRKLMYERHYSATSLIWTNRDLDYGSPNDELSFKKFIESFQGYLIGNLNEY